MFSDNEFPCLPDEVWGNEVQSGISQGPGKGEAVKN